MNLVRPLSEVAQEQRSWASSDHYRVPLGFPILDSRCNGGPAPGELAVFIARSGVGKTLFGCNVAVNTSRLGVPAVFFSLEMHARYILQRLAAIHWGVPTSTIEKQLRADGHSHYVDSFVELFPHLAVVDTPGLSLRQMDEAVDEAEELWGARPRLVIVDYLELVGGTPSLSEVGAVDKTSRKLKDLARRADVVVLVLHQVNKGGGEGEKPLSRQDSRYGGDVAADYVLAAYRPYLSPGLSKAESEALEDQYVIQFLKTRTGGGIAPWGVPYRLDVHSLRLSPPAPQLDPLPFGEEEP